MNTSSTTTKNAIENDADPISVRFLFLLLHFLSFDQSEPTNQFLRYFSCHLDSLTRLFFRFIRLGVCVRVCVLRVCCLATFLRSNNTTNCCCCYSSSSSLVPSGLSGFRWSFSNENNNKLKRQREATEWLKKKKKVKCVLIVDDVHGTHTRPQTKNCV